MVSKVESPLTSRPIDPDFWDGYGGDKWPSLAQKLLGAETAYDAFTKIWVYKESWRQTRELIPQRPEGVVWDMGCGPGNTFKDTLKATEASCLIGFDVSREMVAKAHQVSQVLIEKSPHLTIINEVMDLGKPWGPQLSRFGLTEEHRPDIILSHITLGWLTPAARVQFFKEILNYLAEDGVAVLSFRTDNWDLKRVNKHKLGEFMKSPRATMAALKAKGHSAEIERQINENEVDSRRPSKEEIHELVETNNLKIVQERGTFWPDDPEGPGGMAILVTRR